MNTMTLLGTYRWLPLLIQMFTLTFSKKSLLEFSLRRCKYIKYIGSYERSDTSQGVNMVDVRKEFQQVLYRAGYAASLDLKKKILNGEIRGNKYDKDLNESVCFIGTLASYLGVSSSDFAFSYGYIRNLQNPCESWFLGIVPGDTPRIHARLEFAVYWIDEVLNDIERLPDEWQYELFKRKQSREPKSILSAKV